MFRAAPLIPVLSLILAGFACSLTVPGENQDGVIRCDNVDECPEPSRDMYEAVCKWGEGQDEGSPKVCWEDFKSVSCGSNTKDADLRDALDNAKAKEADYVGCPDGVTGEPSCPPNEGEPRCNADGAVVIDKVCSGPDGEPAVPATKDLAGRDLRDSYCATFFCDKEWVCAPAVGGGDAGQCALCDDDKPVGEGGCGRIYVNGEVSIGYADMPAACDDENGGDGTFGEFPPTDG